MIPIHVVQPYLHPCDQSKNIVRKAYNITRSPLITDNGMISIPRSAVSQFADVSKVLAPLIQPDNYEHRQPELYSMSYALKSSRPHSQSFGVNERLQKVVRHTHMCQLFAGCHHHRIWDAVHGRIEKMMILCLVIETVIERCDLI